MGRSAERVFRAVIHEASWKSAHAEGDLTWATDKAQVHSQLAVSVAQLQDLQRLVGFGMAGRPTGNLSLTPDGERARAPPQHGADGLGRAGLGAGVQRYGGGGDH